MGFKARERKRKKWVAMNAAQSASRKSGSSMGKWWLTIARRDGCCARCGGVFRVGREIVYRHLPMEVRCCACGEADPTIKPRPSLHWEREQRRRRKAGRRR